MRLTKFAMVLATAGISLTLVGAGLSAVFTDSGTVAQDVAIGTFGIALTTTSDGCQVNDPHSITCAAPEIKSSAPANAPISFTVTATGEIPVVVNVTHSALVAPWSSLLEEPESVTLAQGAFNTYNAGLAWSELGPSDLGATASVTYYVVATEA
jgi:hypothetical protein